MTITYDSSDLWYPKAANHKAMAVSSSNQVTKNDGSKCVSAKHVCYEWQVLINISGFMQINITLINTIFHWGALHILNTVCLSYHCLKGLEHIGLKSFKFQPLSQDQFLAMACEGMSLVTHSLDKQQQKQEEKGSGAPCYHSCLQEMSAWAWINPVLSFQRFGERTGWF